MPARHPPVVPPPAFETLRRLVADNGLANVTEALAWLTEDRRNATASRASAALIQAANKIRDALAGRF